MAATLEVDVNIFALMDPYLSRRHDDDAVRNSGDMYRAVDAPCDNDALRYVSESETTEWGG